MNAKAMWNQGKPFNPAELNGIYDVKTIGWILGIVQLFNREWSKAICGCKGHNVTNGNGKWMFTVVYGCDCVELVYRNGKVVDKLRILEDGTIIGMFYFKGKFVGYFLLTKGELK